MREFTPFPPNEMRDVRVTSRNYQSHRASAKGTYATAKPRTTILGPRKRRSIATPLTQEQLKVRAMLWR